jgi:hypothetical protein
LRLAVFMLAATLLAADTAAGVSLRAAVEAAPAGDGYDHDVVLETGTVYTGGLLIGPTWDDDRQRFLDEEPALSVRIVGNGAILDLQGQPLCISFCDRRLDIVDCVIIGGGVRFRGDLSPDVDRAPRGSVRYCTFWRPHEYAVRVQGAGEGIVLERNIVVDPVDTGLGHVIWSGAAGPNLPTGLAFGLSIQTATFGTPLVRENWTWLSDPDLNAEPLHHFGFL